MSLEQDPAGPPRSDRGPVSSVRPDPLPARALPVEPTGVRLAAFVLVNAVTVLALLLGAATILLATRGEIRWAAGCLLGCVVLDGVDGALARRLQVTSPFGAQMDSLADLCGFGLATPLLAYHWLQGHVAPPVLGVTCCMATTCAMIRLARFTVMPKDDHHFAGLPAAMPAVLVAGSVLIGTTPGPAPAALLACLAGLMVTTFPYAKAGLALRLPRWIWAVGAAITSVAPQAAFALAVGAYLLSGPAHWVWRRCRLRAGPRPEPGPARAPDEPHVRTAIVGAGFSGLGMAIRLRQEGMNDFVVLERADGIGGTWQDSAYPGAACDVPSSLYSYSFEPDPDWTRAFPEQPEILRYLHRCAARHGLSPHLRLGHEVVDCRWQADAGCWRIRTTRGQLTAESMVIATGPLSEPTVPDLPGLDEFDGAAFHAMRWDSSVDLRDQRVAVVGTGASAAQLIPEIQPEVAALHVFQRTPAWVLPRWDRTKPLAERVLLRRVPALQRLARTTSYLWREALLLGLAHDQRLIRPVEWLARRYLHSQVPDARLRSALTPDYTLGCKRLILSNDYYRAITQPNTELVTSGIRKVRRDSIVTSDGRERQVDTIIFATGFEPANRIIADRVYGRGDRSLYETWQDGAQAYLGTAVAGFPNLFILLGPNTISGQNSSLLTMESQVEYVLGALTFMRRSGSTAVEVHHEVQGTFSADLQKRMRGTVWSSGCMSWYLDEHGRNTALWPGSTRNFRRRTATFDHESYVVTGWDRTGTQAR